MCKIYTRLCKWTITVHICTVIVQCVNNFLFFFSLSFIKLQQTSAARKKNIQAPMPAPAPPPNYNKPNHHSQCHHQTPQPSTETYPKINRNSKINPTQNQQKPKNQPNPKSTKPKNQPNSKSIKTHWETQPKNSPHPLENLAQRSQICSPIYCHRVFHCCCRIFHCCRQLEVGGEGSVVEERGRAKGKGWAKAKAKGRAKAKAAAAAAS